MKRPAVGKEVTIRWHLRELCDLLLGDTPPTVADKINRNEYRLALAELEELLAQIEHYGSPISCSE